MKKKYFAPEMEELDLDEPVVLSEHETSGGSTGTCETHNPSCSTNFG
jgi:hypothetical protein